MKTLKVIGLLVLVFVAGFSGGVVATRIVVRRMVAVAVAHPEVTREVVRTNIEQNLMRRLRLDQPQRERVHEILKDSRDHFREVRDRFQPQLNAIALGARTNISAVLKPDQEKRFEEFLAENRQFLPIREPAPPKKEPGSAGGPPAR
jgi:hypothetical protein